MRHHIAGYQLNRDTQSRRALFKNLITSMVEYGSIQTTLQKAKAIQGQLDKLITKAKSASLNDLRQIDKVVNRRTIVNRLVKVIAPATKRTSGFTRIVKLARRAGDDALMVRLEFVDAMPLHKEVVAAEEVAAAKPKKTVKNKPVTALKPVVNVPTPVLKSQTAVKAGMIRQKSGDR
jgi:large subunit ribosomal protein L17